MLSYVLALSAAAFFGIFFWRRMQAKKSAIAENRRKIQEIIETVLGDVKAQAIVTAGVESWRGTRNGEDIQVRTIVDTLATRKLPALWLSITVNELVKIDATFDMMARPNSATTFSNFELLPHNVKVPAGFPEFAAVRTDKTDARLPLDVIQAHLGIFNNSKAKELLITPNGVRIVVLAAEADRARYGVFRQADFSDFQLDGATVEKLVAACSLIRQDINRSREAIAA